MGGPNRSLVCASNRNDVLTDFFHTGVYDRRRPFHKTISPSMDILISSNLERFLLEMADGDADQVRGWMGRLTEEGVYDVGASRLSRLRDSFYAGFADDEKTRAAIGRVWREERYLMDPHTAVAEAVAAESRRETGDMTPLLIVSTASPYKFSADVARAVGAPVSGDAFDAARDLEACTGVPAPEQVSQLKSLPVLHTRICGKDQMGEAALAGFGPSAT